jgi:ankyrin repeat protein
MAVSQNGGDALYTSAKNGHIDSTKKLVEIGLPINRVAEKSGCTPLGIAAYSGHMNIVKFLQYKGASLTASDESGENLPLLLGCKTSQMELIEYLLNFSEVLNFKNKFETSPMVYAINTKNEKLVSVFLKAKYDLTIKNSKGESILSQAIRNSSISIAKIIYTTHKFLNWENVDGITPFMQAFIEHNFELVDAMRDMGADVHYQNSKGLKILDIANRDGDVLILDYLKHHKLYNTNLSPSVMDTLIMDTELQNMCSEQKDEAFKNTLDLANAPDWAFQSKAEGELDKIMFSPIEEVKLPSKHNSPKTIQKNNSSVALVHNHSLSSDNENAYNYKLRNLIKEESPVTANLLEPNIVINPVMPKSKSKFAKSTVSIIPQMEETTEDPTPANEDDVINDIMLRRLGTLKKKSGKFHKLQNKTDDSIKCIEKIGGSFVGKEYVNEAISIEDESNVISRDKHSAFLNKITKKAPPSQFLLPPINGLKKKHKTTDFIALSKKLGLYHK